MVALDGQQVVRPTFENEIVSVRALGVHGIRGDHRPGQGYRVQQRSELEDLVGFAVDLPLGQHHPVGVVDRAEQMPRINVAATGTAYPLAVHGDQPRSARRGLGTPRRPATDHDVELVTVQTLQRPPDRRLTGDRPLDPQRREQMIRHPGGPLAIAVNERQPANTAQTPSARIVPTR